MGAFWSLARGHFAEEHRPVESSKRQRLSVSTVGERPQLIPGLPDELSVRILARVPRSCHPTLKLVCRPWHQVMSTKEVYGIRKELGISEEWLYILMKDYEDELLWRALDPLTGRWQRLPPMPQMIPEVDAHQLSTSGWRWWESSSMKLTGLLKGLFRRKESVERYPFCGCASGAVDSCLYVLGGFSRASATRCVWRYDPRVNVWAEAAAMGTPRAYCKTALLQNKLYAVGGVNQSGGGLMPLQSGEVYEPSTNCWKPIPSMPFARAQMLPTAFLADMLKPIATGMASFKGVLCVPQSLYSWPFFVDVGGEVFDPVSNSWGEMPQGMGEGWPARQAGMKLSVVVNGSLYALDPASTTDGSKIEVYDFEADVWKVVLRKVPIVLDLNDSESPYLLAGFGGKLHVITKNINGNVTVLRADLTDNSPSSSSKSESSSESESEGWKMIADRNFGLVELVTCQVLDL